MNAFQMIFKSLLFITIAAMMAPVQLLAQDGDDEAAAYAKANAEFKKVLDDTRNIFYKEGKEEDGRVFYNIVWEHDGQSVRFIAGLRSLGHYDGKAIYAVSMWTYIVDGEKPVPPAVIKAVATANDRLFVGNISCSDDFTDVYANMSGSADNLTSASLWMYAAYLQGNMAGMKEMVKEAQAGSK